MACADQWTTLTALDSRCWDTGDWDTLPSASDNQAYITSKTCQQPAESHKILALYSDTMVKYRQRQQTPIKIDLITGCRSTDYGLLTLKAGECG